MTVLPRLRTEIQIDVHQEDGQDFLILSDTFGIAEGPIMINAEMVDILEACDGATTVEELAATAEVQPDGPEMLRLLAFLGQLTEMGYMEGHAAEQRALAATHEFVSASIRQPVCAGSTYPAEADELHKLLDEMLKSDEAHATDTNSIAATGNAGLVIIPHIDFRVAPTVYGPCFNAIRNTTADLFVMIGTSHYWGQHQFILTTKDFATPIGTVHTDVPLVNEIRERLTAIDAMHPQALHPMIAPNDLAHKPEHSLELHTVFLQHMFGRHGHTVASDNPPFAADGHAVIGDGRPFTILPILVSGLQQYFAHEGALEGALHEAVQAIRNVVVESGRKAVWIVSGDMAHFGARFGDEAPASDMFEEVREADSTLLRHLSAAQPGAFYNAVREADDNYRICGLAPSYVALTAVQPSPGEVVAYEVWDDADTSSAVSFAGLAFP